MSARRSPRARARARVDASGSPSLRHRLMPTSSPRSSRGARVAASLLAALALSASDAHAQRKILRVGADTSVVPTTPAAALPSAGSTDKTLEALRAALRLRPDDPSTLHAIGMRLWELSTTDPMYATNRSNLDADSVMWSAALEHLQRATAVAPDSARFAVNFAAANLSGFKESDRRRALAAIDTALAAARRVQGNSGVARVADSLATIFWMRYDRVAGRERQSTGEYVLPGELAPDVDVPTTHFRVAHTSEKWPGAIDYLQAELLLRTALAADSADERSRRHMLRLLVERDRWADLLDEARRQQRIAPSDPRPWLAEGLAAHRLALPGVDAAFARALAASGAADSARLVAIARILPPADGDRIAQMTPAERGAFDRRAWSLVDPLWATPPNELRVEFLARVSYAELRWSGDYAHEERGADADAGLAYVRAGPPASMASRIPDRLGVVQKVWRYDDGARVVLKLPWGARVPFLGDEPEVATWRQQWTVSWHNVPIVKAIAPLPALAARFRAPGDSADVYVAALLPLEHLLPADERASRPLQVDFWGVTTAGERLWRDSTLAAASRSGTDVARTRVWRRRVPAGAYMYRVEALQPETQRGARGAAAVSTPAGVDFALHGFGVSDLLVAERLQRRTEPPQRWTDYNVVPNAGMVRQGQMVALLWESYELAATPEGTNRYRVELAVVPAVRTRRADFSLRVVGGTAGVGLTGRSQNRVAVGFTRELPARAVHVDDVLLDLGRSPPGTYVVRVTLTDLVSNRSDARETVVTVTK